MAKDEVAYVDEDGVIVRDRKGKRLTDSGAEVPDPRPMAPPVNFKRSPPLHERLRALVQHEFERAKERGEFETPEDADDFATGDDVDEFDAREGRFRDLRGFEYEDNFDAPSDDSELHERLVKAGWTPPSKADRAPSGGDPPKEPAVVPPVDSKAPTAAPKADSKPS